MLKIFKRASLFFCLALATLTLNTQTSDLQLCIVVEKIELITDNGRIDTVLDATNTLDGGVVIDLLSNDVQTDGEDTASFGNLIPGDTYVKMNVYVKDIYFCKDDQTQSIFNTLKDKGFDLSVIKFSSDPNDVNAGTHSLFQKFTYDLNNPPDIDFRATIPQSIITGSAIGNYDLSAPPIFASNGIGTDSKGKMTVKISGLTGGKPLIIGLFTDSSNLSANPHTSRELTSSAGTQIVEINELPFGSYYVGVVERLASTTGTPDFAGDAFAMSGMDTQGKPIPVVLTENSPTASISLTVTKATDFEGQHGSGASKRSMFNTCTKPGTNTVTITIKTEIETTSNHVIYAGLFRLLDGKSATCNSVTKNLKDMWESLKDMTAANAISCFGTITSQIFSETDEPTDCLFKVTYAPVAPGRDIKTKLKFSEVPDGTWTVAMFITGQAKTDSASEGPQVGDRISYTTNTATVSGGKWFHLGTLTVTGSESATSFTFTQQQEQQEQQQQQQQGGGG